MQKNRVSIYDKIDEHHDNLCSSLSTVLAKSVLNIEQVTQITENTSHFTCLAIMKEDEPEIEFSISYNDHYLVYDFTLGASISSIDKYITDNYFYEYYAIYNDDFEYQETILTLRLEGTAYPRVILVIPKNESFIDGTFSTSSTDNFSFKIPNISNFNDPSFGKLSGLLFDIFIKHNNACGLFSIDDWISSILKDDNSAFSEMYKILEMYNE